MPFICFLFCVFPGVCYKSQLAVEHSGFSQTPSLSATSLSCSALPVLGQCLPALEVHVAVLCPAYSSCRHLSAPFLPGSSHLQIWPPPDLSGQVLSSDLQIWAGTSPQDSFVRREGYLGLELAL